MESASSRSTRSSSLAPSTRFRVAPSLLGVLSFLVLSTTLTCHAAENEAPPNAAGNGLPRRSRGRRQLNPPCLAGYVQDATTKLCYGVRGTSCNNTLACAYDLVCTSGTCQCPTGKSLCANSNIQCCAQGTCPAGYTYSATSGLCYGNSGTACATTIDCSYDLVCTALKCACPAGKALFAGTVNQCCASSPPSTPPSPPPATPPSTPPSAPPSTPPSTPPSPPPSPPPAAPPSPPLAPPSPPPSASPTPSSSTRPPVSSQSSSQETAPAVAVISTASSSTVPTLAATEGEKGATSTGAVVGGAVGGLAVLGAVGGFLLLAMRRKRSNPPQRKADPPNHPAPDQAPPSAATNLPGSAAVSLVSTQPLLGVPAPGPFRSGSPLHGPAPPPSGTTSGALSVGSQSGTSSQTVSLRQAHWLFIRLAGPAGLLGESVVNFTGKPLIAVQAHNAGAEDEVSIVPGQFVHLQRVYRDGWGVGHNIDTGAFGIFPIDCLRLDDYMPSLSSVAGSGASIARIESRVFSLSAGGLGMPGVTPERMSPETQMVRGPGGW